MNIAEIYRLYGDAKYDQVAKAVLNGDIRLQQLHMCEHECVHCDIGMTEIMKAIDAAERDESER